MNLPHLQFSWPYLKSSISNTCLFYHVVLLSTEWTTLNMYLFARIINSSELPRIRRHEAFPFTIPIRNISCNSTRRHWRFNCKELLLPCSQWQHSIIAKPLVHPWQLHSIFMTLFHTKILTVMWNSSVTWS